jgi:hypothetical protein
MQSDLDVEDDMPSFCIYCQYTFRTEQRLRVHLRQAHPGTYAALNLAASWRTDPDERYDY